MPCTHQHDRICPFNTLNWGSPQLCSCCCHNINATDHVPRDAGKACKISSQRIRARAMRLHSSSFPDSFNSTIIIFHPGSPFTVSPCSSNVGNCSLSTQSYPYPSSKFSNPMFLIAAKHVYHLSCSVLNRFNGSWLCPICTLYYRDIHRCQSPWRFAENVIT